MNRLAALLLAILAFATPVLAQDERLAILERHFRRGRTIGQAMAAGSDLKNLATALEMYATDHKDALPTRLDQLVPNYLRRLPVCNPSRQPFRYQKIGSSKFVLSTPGQPFADLGLPAGYPKLEGRLLTDADLDRMVGGAPAPDTSTLYVRPKVTVPARWSQSRGADLQRRGLEAMAALRYDEGVKLYRQALAAGGLHPLTQEELKRFLKEWDAQK